MRLVALLLMACCACGRTEPHRSSLPVLQFDTGRDAGVDAGRDGGVDGGRDAGVDAGIRNPAICEGTQAHFTLMMPCVQRVTVLDVTASAPSCFVDVRVRAGDVGTLVWDCLSDAGRAQVNFQNTIFEGNAAAPSVAVCNGTSFPWSDGCFWRSAQRIEGAVAPGAVLTFSYVERPDEGAGCASPCSATGHVRVNN